MTGELGAGGVARRPREPDGEHAVAVHGRPVRLHQRGQRLGARRAARRGRRRRPRAGRAEPVPARRGRRRRPGSSRRRPRRAGPGRRRGRRCRSPTPAGVPRSPARPPRARRRRPAPVGGDDVVGHPDGVAEGDGTGPAGARARRGAHGGARRRRPRGSPTTRSRGRAAPGPRRRRRTGRGRRASASGGAGVATSSSRTSSHRTPQAARPPVARARPPSRRSVRLAGPDPRDGAGSGRADGTSRSSTPRRGTPPERLTGGRAPAARSLPPQALQALGDPQHHSREEPWLRRRSPPGPTR